MTNSAKGKKPSTGGEISWKNDAARKTTNRAEIRQETTPRLPARSKNAGKKTNSNKD